MDLYKDKIHIFVLKYWNYLFIPQVLDISKIKILKEKSDSDYDMEISDIEED
jgi:hypothetical protein